MKTSHFALSGALLLFPLVGCTPTATTENSAAGGDTAPATNAAGSAAGNTVSSAGGKTLKLAFVTNNASDYWTVARKGVEKADKELENVTVEFKLPANGTAAEQTQLVDDLLANGTQGMAISPVDPANQTKFLNDSAKKALIFTQDSDAVKSDRACYIGTDNFAAGRQAGEILKKSLPNGGTVMAFVGNIDSQNAADRFNGVKAAIKDSKVKILDVRTDGTDRTKAKSNVQDALVKYPDLAACLGLYSYNGPAILGAVKDAGKIGKVKIVCFDEEEDTLAGIKSGAIDATVVQQPFEFGYQSIINMSKYLNGDKSVVPKGKQLFVPTKAITKADVDAFKTQLDKLRAG